MNLYHTAKFIWRHPLNRTGRLAAVRRFLRWQLASRLMPYPVAIPIVDDYRLLVERGMTGATGNFYCGLHEADDMAFILHFLRSGDAFYDIGANVGSYSVLAAAAGASEVRSFEPSVASCARLRRNVVFNGLGDRIVVHQCALGERDGEVRFSRSLDTTNHVVVGDEDTAAVEMVPMKRFDDFFLAGRASFVKVDVEGYESQVLSGATTALADPCLMGMLIEDNGSNRRYQAHSGVGDVLKSYGFKPFRYDPVTRELAAADESAGTFGNILFLRDASVALERVKSAPRFRLINGMV